jgi:hypothetical protein
LIDLDDTLDGMNFFLFRAGKEMKISTKIIKQLGGSVRLSPNKHVNMVVVSDSIFELEPMELANPEHSYQEIP